MVGGIVGPEDLTDVAEQIHCRVITLSVNIPFANITVPAKVDRRDMVNNAKFILSGRPYHGGGVLWCRCHRSSKWASPAFEGVESAIRFPSQPYQIPSKLTTILEADEGGMY